jgi:hypothetical protein
MKKIAVLGRGKSLEVLNSLPEVDAYIITNNWGLELNQQFIMDRFSDNKPIINILSLSVFNTPGLSFGEMVKVYKNFNIQKIILPYVRECVPPGERSYFTVEGKNKAISSEPLPDEVKPFMWEAGKGNCPQNYTGKRYDVPTTGMAGVLYATAIMNPEEVYICGIDFYEKEYAFQTSREKERNKIDSNGIIGVSEFERIPMKIFLTENIIGKFPNKKFFISTYGNYNPNKDNVEVNIL